MGFLQAEWGAPQGYHVGVHIALSITVCSPTTDPFARHPRTSQGLLGAGLGAQGCRHGRSRTQFGLGSKHSRTLPSDRNFTDHAAQFCSH